MLEIDHDSRGIVDVWGLHDDGEGGDVRGPNRVGTALASFRSWSVGTYFSLG